MLLFLYGLLEWLVGLMDVFDCFWTWTRTDSRCVDELKGNQKAGEVLEGLGGLGGLKKGL